MNMRETKKNGKRLTGTLAVVLAMLVGLLAGYFPAKRAMKLSPLEAIRH